MIDVEPGPDVTGRIAAAVTRAKASDTATVIHVTSDPLLYGPDGEGWWDVPIAEVSELESTQRARSEYLEQRERQKPLLG